ncbi:xylose repressor [Longispora fulva]|uniref:Putative NBD/HSP70 family sugar kinase n=1 Tax=Longispora fulva TaxID=619741 RepID=A0A8J7KQ04_9ACTN|nr:ROK family transcriptional regulator [Longispora fulva]MBG6136887.1 putative NBD/HSP70 family sugar kinase [Longispora fulva]GIG60058.1 xylose repressor [Longispora fulva]
MITQQSGPRPADVADVRTTNLVVVLRFVRAHAPCSRADVAAATGLTKATVSSLVADLLDRRLLRETGVTENRIGRPATMLEVDGSPYAAIGMEINADYLTAVAMDVGGTRLLSWRRAFDGTAGPASGTAALAALARRVIARLRADGRGVLGVTVGVPGLVDAAGVVHLAPNLRWQDVDLRADLHHALGGAFDVLVDNDANLGVAAEYRYGPHAGTPDLVYLTGEVGIGAGIIAEGRLLRGSRGYSGEIGHVPVVPDGPPCGCGRRGCLEAVVGLGALIGGPPPTPEHLTSAVRDLVTRAGADDRHVLEALDLAGDRLGRGLSVLANLLNPETIVLGGYYVPLAPWLLPSARAALRSGVLAPDSGGTLLAASTLGHSAAALGGAARVIDLVDAGRIPLLDPA